MPEPGLSRVSAFAMAIGVFAADFISKRLIEKHLSFDDVQVVIPNFFNLVRSQNSGVAFSMFAESGGRWHGPALALFSVTAVLILAGMLWKIDRMDRLSAVGLSLIFGGAMGNVYDRISMGAVTDFLDFYIRDYHWYTFNIADCGICVGAGLLILSGLKSPKKPTDKEAGGA